jgi:DinB superfamily
MSIPVDLAAVRAGKATYADQIKNISYQDLRTYIDEVFQTFQSTISSATDAEANFVARDPQATTGNEVGWTPGHVIAHMTATLEETAAIASVLARGVQIESGLRLRYETFWEEIRTAQQLQARLAESQRICNAYLDAWPEQPHLDVTITRIPFVGPTNAIGVCAMGIAHAQGHYEQLKEIMRQAQTGSHV